MHLTNANWSWVGRQHLLALFVLHWTDRVALHTSCISKWSNLTYIPTFKHSYSGKFWRYCNSLTSTEYHNLVILYMCVVHRIISWSLARKLHQMRVQSFHAFVSWSHYQHMRLQHPCIRPSYATCFASVTYLFANLFDWLISWNLKLIHDNSHWLEKSYLEHLLGVLLMIHHVLKRH